MEPFIFISWSGAKSKGYATVIKTLLMENFKFKNDDIFLSVTGITGNEAWLETIRNKASNASIIIVCITPENMKSPWIHYEVGISSHITTEYSRNSFKTRQKKIIPVLLDMTTKDLETKLTMLSCHQMVCADNTAPIKHYELLLQHLLYQIDHAIRNNGRDLNYLRIHQYEKLEDCNTRTKSFKIAVNSMAAVNALYSKRDFFISRPMAGIDVENKFNLDRILNNLTSKENDRKNTRIFFADTQDDNRQDIPSSRIAIIKNCETFILIYPEINNTLDTPPSSCLIELGAALAFNKQIKLLIEEGANTPEFINLLQEQCNRISFSSYDELEQKLNELIFKKQ